MQHCAFVFMGCRPVDCSLTIWEPHWRNVTSYSSVSSTCMRQLAVFGICWECAGSALQSIWRTMASFHHEYREYSQHNTYRAAVLPSVAVRGVWTALLRCAQVPTRSACGV